MRGTSRDESQCVPSPEKLFKTRDLELPIFEGSLPSCWPHSAGYTRTSVHPYFPVAKRSCWKIGAAFGNVSGTEKVPQRTFAAKNFQVNFLVRFASKPLLCWIVPLNGSENYLVLFVRFFGFGVLFWLLNVPGFSPLRPPQPSTEFSCGPGYFLNADDGLPCAREERTWMFQVEVRAQEVRALNCNHDKSCEVDAPLVGPLP